MIDPTIDFIIDLAALLSLSVATSALAQITPYSDEYMAQHDG
jgi:hypothetical protein